MARASRLFLRRAVGYLAGEAGVRQFLDIGAGLPSTQNTHDVAQRVAPDSRVIYVDNDPLVMSHARALLRSVASDTTGYIEGDLRAELVDLVRAHRPAQCTLVPVVPGEITSQAGWKTGPDTERLPHIVGDLKARGIRVSLFVDPEPGPARWAASIGG